MVTIYHKFKFNAKILQNIPISRQNAKTQTNDQTKIIHTAKTIYTQTGEAHNKKKKTNNKHKRRGKFEMLPSYDQTKLRE